MFFKTALFLFGFFPAVLLSQIEDSVLIYPFAHTQDPSNIVHADTIKSSIDTLVTLSEKVSTNIYQQPFSNQSTFITKTDILRNDYRYTGDFLKLFPFSFERSYGFIGQPNDIYLYAEGTSSTSYFMDGVPISNALYYSLDFNHIQSEDIDSIEIVPLPRGFLYGFSTNPVSVNFISKDIIPTKPYSRIKHYEGPFGEAFIDGIFSLNLFKGLIASVDITNRKVDDSYKNSAFAIWQTKAKLRYNLSDDINVIGSYYFSKSTTGINGGVNVDEIKLTTNDVNSILYNETLAPVYSENNSLDFKQHNFGLKLLAKPFENAITEVNLYYQFYQNEYNKIFSDTYTTVKANTTDKNKLYGFVLNQRFIVYPLEIKLGSGYQFTNYNHSNSIASNTSYYWSYSDYWYYSIDYNKLFISPILSAALFDSMLVPSIFYKKIYYKSSESRTNSFNDLSRWGTDLFVHFSKQFNLYIGFSDFGIDYFSEKRRNVLELNFIIKNPCGTLNLGIFNKNLSSDNLWGLGVNASSVVWKILIEGRISQYFIEENSKANLPKTNLNLGLYYKELLFNSNLDLKAGFIANYMGKQNLNDLYIPYLQRFITSKVVSRLTIDFTLSAEIQKAAIVYFTWENLFDWKYYITPYYPMLERNIRFGVAWEIFN